MGGRKLGGYTHTAALDTIPDEADIWFDHPNYGSPQKAKISTLLHKSAPLPAGPQLLTDTGVIDAVTYKADWSTTAAATATMDDGNYYGQQKVIQMVADIGDAVLTPDNLLGYTTITFAAVGDTAHLMWDDAAWVIVDLYNRADGATKPVAA